MKKNTIKKKELPLVQIKEIKEFFAYIKSYLPEQFRLSNSLIPDFLNFFNDFAIVFCYIILLGQTARLMVNEQKYVNTKVLMVKWIVFIFFELIFSHISKENIEGSLIKSVFFFGILAIIYPSNASKSIFQKYFNGQQSLKESSLMTDSFVANNNSLLVKLLVVVFVQWLKIFKYALTFINPSQRRSIKEEVNEINIILNEEKYFWKIYNSEEKKDHQRAELKKPLGQFGKEVESRQQLPEFQVAMMPTQNQSSNETGISFQEMIEKQLRKGIIEAMEMEKKNYNDASTMEGIKETDPINETFSGIKSPPIHQTPPATSKPSTNFQAQLQLLQQSQPLQTPPHKSLTQFSTQKQKKYKKYSVSEYLPLFSTANRSSVYPNLPNKRCTYYREIEISYDVNEAVMTVTSLEDMKVSYHSLEEIVLLEELMVQFQFEQDEQIMVKFKNKTQFEEFISSIDMYESSLRNK